MNKKNNSCNNTTEAVIISEPISNEKFLDIMKDKYILFSGNGFSINKDDVILDDGRIVFKEHIDFIKYLKNNNLDVYDDAQNICINLPNKFNKIGEYASYAKGVVYNFKNKNIMIDEYRGLEIKEALEILNIINGYDNKEKVIDNAIL